MPPLDDLRQYVGNPNRYSLQSDDGSYRPVEEPVTDSLLQAHLDGTVTVGTYTLDYDKAKHIVFDADAKDGENVNTVLPITRAIQRECQHRAMYPAVEFSGSKGYHVWLLLEEWTLAADVRRLAKDIAHAVGFNGEVFPKQAVAERMGNLVKLPYGLHRKANARSRVLTKPKNLVTGERFKALLEAVPAGDEQHNESHPPPRPFVRLPCLDSLMRDPPHEGERHNALFMFAGRMWKAGLLHDQVYAVLATLCDPNDLRPGEFDTIVTDSGTMPPGRCESYLDATRLCPADLCIQTRDSGWKTQRPGEVLRAADGDLVAFAVKHTTNPAVREISHPDLSIARVSLRSNDGD